MSDIFQEVDEDIRRDQWAELWKRFGKYIIGAAVAVVLAVAGNSYLQYTGTKEADKDSAAFESLLAQADTATGLDRAALFAGARAQMGEGYGALVALREAAAYAKAGDTGLAVAAYDALAADSGADQHLRDLAAYLAARTLMDIEDLDAVSVRLTPLTAEGRTFALHASELLGQIALNQGDIESAFARFEAIANDVNASQGLASRAQQMLNLISESQPAPVVFPEALAPTEAETDITDEAQSAVEAENEATVEAAPEENDGEQ